MNIIQVLDIFYQFLSPHVYTKDALYPASLLTLDTTPIPISYLFKIAKFSLLNILFIFKISYHVLLTQYLHQYLQFRVMEVV